MHCEMCNYVQVCFVHYYTSGLNILKYYYYKSPYIFFILNPKYIHHTIIHHIYDGIYKRLYRINIHQIWVIYLRFQNEIYSWYASFVLSYTWYCFHCRHCTGLRLQCSTITAIVEKIHHRYVFPLIFPGEWGILCSYTLPQLVYVHSIR